MRIGLRGLVVAVVGSALLPACSSCSEDGLTGLKLGVRVAPASLSFEATPVALERSAAFSITNIGGAPLTRLSVVVEPADSPFVIAERPVEQLPAGGSIEVSIAFAPLAAGDLRAFAIASAEGVASASVALAGIGLAAPDCDDHNPCTRDFYALDSTCTYEQVEGACDDQNACTTDEVCVEGRCLGLAVTCEPPASCFLGLCDVKDGCVYVSDPSACDDGDPCTDDVCTTGGCTHDTAPNGTPCGAFVECVSVHVCVLGSCVEASVPNDTPCSDGDTCTERDRCNEQRCSGEAVTRPAELVDFEPTFGGSGSVGVVLGDGRVVILDPLQDGRGAIATVLERRGADVEIVLQALHPELTQFDRGSAVATSSGAELAVLDDTGGVSVFDVRSTGELVLSGSANLLAAPGSGRTKLVTFGDTWYACVLGRDDVAIIDAQDRASMVVVGEVPALGCSSLAINAARSELLISSFSFSSAQALTRFSLADPHLPLQESVAARDTPALVATNGTLIAVADPGPFARTTEIELLDALTLNPSGTFDVGGSFFSDAFSDLAFDGDRLFVQSKSFLSVWDVSDPSAAMQLYTVERSGVGNGSNFPPLHVVSTDGRTLVRAGELVFGGTALLLDVEGDTPRVLQHRARGRVLQLQRHDGVLYGLDAHSIHALDDSDPDRPRYRSGTLLPLFEGDMALWSLGRGAAPPRYLVGSTIPGTYTSAYSAYWRDGHDPAMPLALSPAFAPFRGGIFHVVDDGHRAAALFISNDEEVPRLLMWNLDALSVATIEPGWAPDGMFELSTESVERNYGMLALGGDRAVVVTIDPIADPFDVAEVPSSDIHLLHIGAFPSAARIGSAEVDGYVLSAGVFGDRVVAVVKITGSVCCGSFVGELVRTYVYDGVGLVVEDEVELLEAGDVLEVTEQGATIATRRGVAFIGLAPRDVSLIEEVELPDPPTSAIDAGDRAWFAGPHGVASVKPPCP